MSGSITYARGVNKTVAIAQETSYGVQSTATGKLLRRTSADFNLTITPVESREILPSQQVRDWRLGPRQVQGRFTGQLSPGSYALFFQGLLRSTFTAGATVSGVTDSIVSETTTQQANTLIVNDPQTTSQLGSASTNFNAAGFMIGDIIRISGLTGSVASANGQNYQIIGFYNTNDFSTVPALPAWSTGQTIGVSVVGAKLTIPPTGQLQTSYTFEEWYSDISTSMVYTGVRITQMTLNIPASGFVTLTASMQGQQQTVGSSQVYSSAAAVDTETSLTAVSGQVIYRGVPVLYITGATVQIQANTSQPPVVGSNISPNIFLGTLMVTGSITCLMPDDVLLSDYLNEAEVTLMFLMTTSPATNADFINLVLPCVKLSSATKTDSDTQITRSFNFMALENTGSILFADFTTIKVQDSTQT